MNTFISIFTEIPKELNESLKNYLEIHPNWNTQRFFTYALSLFILQNHNNDISQSIINYRTCARVYLEILFEQSD